MTRDEAEKYANNMTYRDAINNLMKARCIPYRKATFIKVNELLKALEQEPYDDAKYHEEHGEVVVDKAVWEDAKRALEQEPCEDAISRQALKHKLQEHHDFFVNAYGGFSNLPQNDKSRVDEILNCIAMVVNEPSINTQPCEDAVSREAVDDILCLYSDGNGMIDAGWAVRMVRELPSVKPQEPKWIPVSERLPQINEWVLCQCRTCYKVLRLTSYRCYHNDTQEYMDSFVIAWMPLPQPYKDGGEE